MKPLSPSLKLVSSWFSSMKRIVAGRWSASISEASFGRSVSGSRFCVCLVMVIASLGTPWGTLPHPIQIRKHVVREYICRELRDGNQGDKERFDRTYRYHEATYVTCQ
ncbi:hypothetical protein FNV43_RR13275 [Rhamnella rubrinervis]|uniref:Uncharacterized protein n=1 Tax=Rhamnella rubrinervis TaxID=2594499 RepID=A0A8K0MEZ0_9ROSA|nr:hypothetical protein FNV43_RR13275 [Rhamnella rubrinervis]